MKKRTVLYAEDGKILTNGKIYGRVIYLAEGVASDAFYEITEAEFETIKREEELKNDYSPKP